MPEFLFGYNCRLVACNFSEKETPAHVFSSQYCEIFKNTCLTVKSGAITEGK